MPYHDSQLPSRFWHDGITRALAKRRGEIGATILAAQRTGLFPEMPLELLVALIAPTRLGDNRADARPGSGTPVAFHQIGLFRIPAGRALHNAQGVPTGPAPNPNPSAPHNTWGRLHGTLRVRTFLGHAATMVPDAWETDVRAQVAIGLEMLAEHARDVARACDASVRPTSAATPWGAALTLMGFYAGPTGAAAVAAGYVPRLVRVSEAHRFGCLIHEMSLDIAGGWDPGGAPDQPSNLAHRVLRTWQTIEHARQLARQTGGGPPGFYDVFLGDAQDVHERVILRGNWRMKVGAGDTIAPREF